MLHSTGRGLIDIIVFVIDSNVKSVCHPVPSVCVFTGPCYHIIGEQDRKVLLPSCLARPHARAFIDCGAEQEGVIYLLEHAQKYN
jgi:hypothetical protein